MMLIFLRLYLLLGLSTMLSMHEEHRVSNVPNKQCKPYNCFSFITVIFQFIYLYLYLHSSSQQLDRKTTTELTLHDSVGALLQICKNDEHVRKDGRNDYD